VSDRVLVVEDEHDIAALVAYHLTREGYRVRTVGDGVEAVEALSTDLPDLMVLDLMLPGMSGLDVLRSVRSRVDTESLPVILLTARKEEQDRVAGFRVGADDYVSKPFSPQELVLRVGAVLRRTRQQPPAASGGRLLRGGPVTVDTGAARVTSDGEPLDLTPTEYRLLVVLLERRGRVQSRRQLLESVWETTADITTRTVDMHVQRLRSKLGPAGAWVETVRGFGYCFRPENSPG
jgi:two-component system, OmpR family, phosphate regulon response regulator PhoB